MAKSFQLRLLGPFDARDGDGRPISISARKNRALLALVALSPYASLSRGQLASFLWSERPDANARASLRQSLAYLRKDFAAIAALVFSADDDRVWLDLECVEIDVVAFRQLAASADPLDLRRAMDLYRGELLEDTSIDDLAFSNWIADERTRIHEMAIAVCATLWAADAGRPRIDIARRLVALDPLRESSHQAMIQSCAEAGERALALQHYEACSKILRSELGISPSSEIELLRRRLLDGTSVEDEARGAMDRQATPKPPQKLAIAVLPFDNISGDPEQSYFSDGMTEDIIAGLSRFSELLVIARNSSFQFRGQAIDVREIGRKLGVQFIVEGSVRKSSNRVRVTVELIDISCGAHVWTERYDCALTDVFDIQDEVTGSVVSQIVGHARAVAATRIRARPTESLSAYDFFLQAREYFGSDPTAWKAEPFLAKAIELDPNFADAHALLSMMHTISYLQNSNPYHLEKALSFARRALEIDPAAPLPNHSLGYVLSFMRKTQEAGHYLRQSIALNPNEPYFRGEYANWMNYSGDVAGALREIDEAFRRDPYGNDWFWAVRGNIEASAGQYEVALSSLRRMKVPSVWSHLLSAYCCVELGRMSEARDSIASYRRLTDIEPTDFVASRPYADTTRPVRIVKDLLLAEDGAERGRSS